MRMVRSKTVQLFYRKDGEPVEFYPRFCMDDGMITATGAPCLSNGLTLAEQMKRKPDSTICFWRTYALGDILVLTPIFNSLKEKYPNSKILFATADTFVPLFEYWEEIRTVRKRAILRQNYDIGYYLDGVVEKDHGGGKYRYMHRLDINCDFMGWPVPKDPIFSLPFSDTEQKWAGDVTEPIRSKEKPIVVIQLSGAMWFNRFPLGKAMRIAEGISRDCSVIMVHNRRQNINVDGIVNLTGQTTFHKLAALIDSADVAITMDSGALWVAHCTKTPIIAMFGHTRAKEKMAHHRNYQAIDLAAMVGCQSCFGRQTTCKGKVNCLNHSDTSQIIKEIKDGIGKLVS